MISNLKKVYASLGRFKALYLISAIELLLIVGWSIYSGEGMTNLDTPSYYKAFDVLMSGKLDAYRTPLFPLLVGLFRAIFGMRISIVMVYVFQSYLFLLSIGWFGKMLENIIPNKKIVYWFTAIYGLYPGGLSFCGSMMTESITVSLISALLYLVSEAYYNNSRKKAALSGIICMFLWMQRPSLMAVPVLLTVMWGCLLFKKQGNRRVAIWGFSASIFSLIALSLYSMAYKIEYQRSGVSAISTWNNYMLVRNAHVYDPYVIDSSDMSTDVDSIMKISGIDCEIGDSLWHELVFLEDKYGIVGFDNFVNSQLKANPQKIFKFLCLDRLDSLIDANCVSAGVVLPPPLRLIMRIMNISNGTAFMIFLMGLTLLMSLDIKRKNISYFTWLIFAMFAANYFTIWIGAPGDFPRLLAQNYPVLIAVSCWTMNRLMRVAYR